MRVSPQGILRRAKRHQECNEADTALSAMLCADRTQVAPHWLGLPQLFGMQSAGASPKSSQRVLGIPKLHSPLGSLPKISSLQLLPISKGLQFGDNGFQPFKPTCVIGSSKCRLPNRFIHLVGFREFGDFIS
jgi:hypothetical protein